MFPGILPLVDLEVIGSEKKVRIKALVDTGFTGYLCIPFAIAKDLGLILCDQEKFELANGQWVTQFKFKGKVSFLGKIQAIDILVSDSETSQIGTFLLADCRLTIDFLLNKVQITRKKI